MEMELQNNGGLIIFQEIKTLNFLSEMHVSLVYYYNDLFAIKPQFDVCMDKNIKLINGEVS